ncbi:MAG TPA: hypothetical protein VGH50_06640 [Candidatus Binatia bacterium]
MLLPALAFAQYTVVLKNGRRITTQSYREEGNAIKIDGLGGEIALPRDQVQTILRGEEGQARGLDLRERSSASQASPSAPTAAPAETTAPGRSSTEGLPTPEDEKKQEENDYRKKVQDLTEELKAAQNNYFTASRGSASPEPSVITNDDAMRRRTDDLNARLRDAQQNPGGGADGGPVRLESPSPFVGQPPVITEIPPGNVPPTVNPPPPGYTSSEQQLSDLRNRMTDLTKQREQLIEEMKQKNLDTANMFLQ